jgi:hypothetical protein
MAPACMRYPQGPQGNQGSFEENEIVAHDGLSVMADTLDLVVRWLKQERQHGESQ